MPLNGILWFFGNLCFEQTQGFAFGSNEDISVFHSKSLIIGDNENMVMDLG